MIKKWCLKIVKEPKIKKRLKKISEKIQKISPVIYDKVIFRLKDYVRNAAYEEGYLKNTQNSINKQNKVWSFNTKKLDQIEKPLISIIVPNYNHAPYLEQRLDSIYLQDYEHVEIILLDDGSTDHSVSILKRYKDLYPERTRLYVNKTNGGGVFKQWLKGISLARGKFIWIAESDDYCQCDFLSKMAPLLSDEAVMLAFCRSVFVQNGKEIYTTEEYLQELEFFDWNTSFSVTAHEIVRHGWALKNIIPNVSSMIFRNIGQIPEEVTNLWGELKLCGDWLFYLNLVKGGVLAYSNDVTNYYRIHENSTSLKIQKSPRYYQEYEIIASYVARNYEVDFEMFIKQEKTLKDHYMHFHEEASQEDLKQWYHLDVIKNEMNKKRPNVMIAGFSMIMGGGETFPITLANALKEAGIAVTFFDFEMSEYDPLVRSLLHADVPIVKVSRLISLAEAVEQMGIDSMHSHHGCVDEVISRLLLLNPHLKAQQFITLHGMYEAIDKADLERLLSNVSKTCCQFIYTADKNLEVFKNRKDINYTDFKKIRNGLLKYPISSIKRETLGIEESAFVLCLVSRGIPEKGWMEAVKAVSLARNQSNLDIQLLLIGDGEMYEVLEKECPFFVHLLGVKSNIRDYFACSDMGFLPSRFKGESFPLVVIDCLLAGRPVIGSNIGEIKYQLTTNEGKIAGALFDLENWQIPIGNLADLIVAYAQDRERYEEALSAVEAASKKFDIHEIAKQYMNVYEKYYRKNGVQK